ncbi:MAG: hypothetical protein LBF60_01540, partial [Treponema sp.]|nr:hypothetical protein [Treponema sp.]
RNRRFAFWNKLKQVKYIKTVTADNGADTRSRDHKKNDNRFVEQKNGAAVREYAGYDRLERLEEQRLLAAACRPPLPPLNFFTPTQKLKRETRAGSKEIKVCDEPKSPLQRLAESAALSQKFKDALSVQRALYNPAALQRKTAI